MENLIVKPHDNLKKVWYVIWLICFVVLAGTGYLLLALIEDREGRLVMGITTLITGIVGLLVIPYIPAFFRSLEYRIEDKAVTGKKGVFWKKTSTVPYFKITNIDITQGPLQRVFGIGKIHCQTAGAGSTQGARAELVLQGIHDLEGIKDAISARYIEDKKYSE